MMTGRNYRQVFQLVLTVLAVAGFSAGRAGAQPHHVTMIDMATGGEYESYLRSLQVAGLVPMYPVSIRGYSHREIVPMVEADTAGPWAADRQLSQGAGALRAPATTR